MEPLLQNEDYSLKPPPPQELDFIDVNINRRSQVSAKISSTDKKV